MVNKILCHANFILNKTYKETRFLKPPKETYAVFTDSYNRRGADDCNLITEHSIDIELYSYSPNPDAEKRIEDSFDYFKIPYTKNPRFWIQTEQLFQTIYSFEYIEK